MKTYKVQVDENFSHTIKADAFAVDGQGILTLLIEEKDNVKETYWQVACFRQWISIMVLENAPEDMGQAAP